MVTFQLFKLEHTYAVVDETRVARQHRRPRPQVGAARPQQPTAERHIQQIQPRIEGVLTAATTRQSSDTRRRANSDKDTHCTRGTSEAFKPKKKRPASWPSINEPRVVARIKPSKTVDQELGRVYDSVALPKSQPRDGAVGGTEYNKLSYEGYPKKEVMSPSLDTLPLSSMYSRLNTSNDPFQAPAISKLSASAHSVPDIEEKREAITAKKDTKSKEIVEPVQQVEQAMTEDDVTLSPLYSNVNGNMHPVLSKQNKPTPPMYSVPDMKKKREARKLKREHSDQELVLQVRQIPPQNEADASAPLYSNVSEEMSKTQGQPYCISADSEKKWQSQENLRDKSEGGLERRVEQVKEFPVLQASSPLYSNLIEEKVSAPLGPIYSVPDMDKKKKERKAKNDKGPKNLADQAHQAYPMEDLTPLTSAPLYSNMGIEMSAVQGNASARMPDQSTPMYSVPDMNKKRQERLAQIKEGRQCVKRNASSPSLPPIPQLDITDSLHGQSTTFNATDLEPVYPHVSVPSYLKKVKPMPSGNTPASDEAADKAHLYDHPRRKDIYKPLPLEGFYDFPSSKPLQQALVDKASFHYDVPSSLSLNEAAADTRGPVTGHERGQENLEHRVKTKTK